MYVEPYTILFNSLDLCFFYCTQVFIPNANNFKFSIFLIPSNNSS